LRAGHGPQRLDWLAGHVRLELRNVVAKYPFERSHGFQGIQPNSGHRDYSRLSCGVWETQLGPSARISAGCLRWQELPRFSADPFRLAGGRCIAALKSLLRQPETQIDYRPDGLRRRPPCCFSVASWSLRTRRHGVISDFEWTFVHFCSCLPSMQIMTRPLARFAPSA
jgi:hypothetical protein